MQFDTTINDWHTCANTARINASNPCSEYMFLDDTACNLASLNLMNFRTSDGDFDVEAFKHAVDVVDARRRRSSSTTPATRPSGSPRTRCDYRPLGLGYANLGALLMAGGLPYDSDEGRAYAARDHRAHDRPGLRCSRREIAETHRAPSPATPRTASRCCGVIRKHREAAYQHRAPALRPATSSRPRRDVWDEALAWARSTATATRRSRVLAPTGTIGFMMDCDTTGIEPDIALVKYKKLVGGGMLKIVNQTVPRGAEHAGLRAQTEIEAILAYLDENETIEGAPRPQARAPAGLRLRLQARQGQPLHPLHGPPQA